MRHMGFGCDCSVYFVQEPGRDGRKSECDLKNYRMRMSSLCTKELVFFIT